MNLELTWAYALCPAGMAPNASAASPIAKMLGYGVDSDSDSSLAVCSTESFSRAIITSSALVREVETCIVFKTRTRPLLSLMVAGSIALSISVFGD